MEFITIAEARKCVRKQSRHLTAITLDADGEALPIDLVKAAKVLLR